MKSSTKATKRKHIEKNNKTKNGKETKPSEKSEKLSNDIKTEEKL